MTSYSTKPQFSALKRIMSDIEEPQQAAWVVFFKRLWVGRHASYACERIEALQKWNLHCMSSLKQSILVRNVVHHTMALQNVTVSHDLKAMWENRWVGRSSCFQLQQLGTTSLMTVLLICFRLHWHTWRVVCFYSKTLIFFISRGHL